MITPILERLILQGKAQYKIHNHNFASYGVIVVPKDSMTVVVDLLYYPHINISDKTLDTYADVMQYYNETSVVFESDNKQTYYNFKNAVDITVLKPFVAATPLSELWASGDVFIQPKPPLKVDTYLATIKDITIRAYRNVSYANHYSGANGSITMAVISDNSDEPVYPRGLKSDFFANPVPIETVNQVRSGANAIEHIPMGDLKAAMRYLPFGINKSTAPIPPFDPNAVEQYAQGVHLKTLAPDLSFKGSAYQNIDNQPANAAAQAFPLIMIGYVSITDVDALKELNDKFTFQAQT